MVEKNPYLKRFSFLRPGSGETSVMTVCADATVDGTAVDSTGACRPESHRSRGPIDLQTEMILPALEVPESRLFCHPTRLVDFWVPKAEQVIMPSYSLPEQRLQLRVRTGDTSALGTHHWSKNVLRR